jgi:hypothetical protein
LTFVWLWKSSLCLRTHSFLSRRMSECCLGTFWHKMVFLPPEIKCLSVCLTSPPQFSLSSCSSTIRPNSSFCLYATFTFRAPVIRDDLRYQVCRKQRFLLGSQGVSVRSVPAPQLVVTRLNAVAGWKLGLRDQNNILCLRYGLNSYRLQRRASASKG